MRTSFESCRSMQTDCIFVVENDEVVRSALQFILKHHGEDHGFKSLDHALAKAAGLRPQLVLLGVGILQAGGDHALTAIASRWPDTKILVVADSIHDPLARASLKRGAHDVLRKPISFDSVRCKVDALLGRNDMARALVGLLPLSAAW